MLIKNLSFKFDKKNADYFFKNITIECTPHKVHFIRGDNGVGKSTLFNILRGAFGGDVFCEASVILDDVTYTTQNNTLPEAFTRQMHTVRQNYADMVADRFTFTENLQLANLPTYPCLQSLPQATLFDIVKTSGIDPDKPVYMLSGGQRQLTAILMALQKPTKVLLLDEPTATLDEKNADLIVQCLNQLATQLKVTMLIICHDRELIKRYVQDKSFIMRRLENGIRTVECRLRGDI